MTLTIGLLLFVASLYDCHFWESKRARVESDPVTTIPSEEVSQKNGCIVALADSESHPLAHITSNHVLPVQKAPGTSLYLFVVFFE